MKMENEKIYGQTTICARATAPGQGAVAIVRVSGPEAVEVLDKVFRPFKDKVPAFQGQRAAGCGVPAQGDALRADYFP